ncbi:RNA 2',3'-cyclic phosphodiesterase [Candidatus Micrarchaeota archaeon]|nr:RNA 2',3'-cyclic phosphodiesterase [Candidatus Micrarchaeota archaeon]
MRLFVAVELPGKIRRRLGEAAKDLPENGLKKVESGKMHISLKFLGEVGEGELDRLIKSLGNVEFFPFFVEVEGVGAFPSREYVRVIWAGTKSRGLDELAEKVEKALGGLFSRENRAFSGHVTLARVRKKSDFSGFFGKYDMEKFGKLQVNKFMLMKSVLQRGGSEYSVVAEFPAKST